MLDQVSQMPGKMSMLSQVTPGSSQPFAEIGKKLAVSSPYFKCYVMVFFQTCSLGIVLALTTYSIRIFRGHR